MEIWYNIHMAEAGISGPTQFHNLRSLWLGLHISGGHVGLPITVITFIIARHLKHTSKSYHPTLTNFCVTWIIYSIIYCLTLYERQPYEKVISQNPSSVCYAQAALTRGAAPMSAVAGLLLVIQLLLAQRQHSLSNIICRRWLNNVLILAPPYLTLALFTSMATIGIFLEKMTVYTNGFFCSFEDDRSPLTLMVPAFCAVVMVAIIGIEVVIWFYWFRWRNRVRELCPLHETHSFTMSLAIRAAVFTGYCVVTLCACVAFLAYNLNSVRAPFPYIVQASLPLVAFIVFATQEDALRIWLYPFIRKKLDMERLPSRQNSHLTDIPSAREKVRISTISTFSVLSYAYEAPQRPPAAAGSGKDIEKQTEMHVQKAYASA